MNYAGELADKKGLSSDLTSFNFKLQHGLLVTKQRQHHFNPRSIPTCSHCDRQVEEDLQHDLLHGDYNAGVGQSLLSVAQIHTPDISSAHYCSWQPIRRHRTSLADGHSNHTSVYMGEKVHQVKNTALRHQSHTC